MNCRSSRVSAGLVRFSWASVDSDANDWVAEQKLPNPCVGKTPAAASTSALSRWAEAYWWRTRSWVWSGPSRSGRPTEPYSSDPPVNTATWVSTSDSAYDRCVKVWPGVDSTLTRIRSPTPITSPSDTGTRSKVTGSAALTWYAAPVTADRAWPPVT